MPNNKLLLGTLALVAMPVMAAITWAASRIPERPAAQRVAADQVMLILRGIANSENPRGQLDDPSALQYAQRLGFRGEVLDVAGNTGADSPQVMLALERIRRDETVTALYGFSGGGYNARLIWQQLAAAERERIRKVIVLGSPEVAKADFPGTSDILIKADPPEGHMAGPKALLESLDREREPRG
jgi:pimeloyl-ACP methyl ester carboxylesterase